ncbi:MAG: hypothetical protein SFY32_03025 [Bacteroidota bacterium]|nr:hypothetical protein [Bacteroidota bacterium]
MLSIKGIYDEGKFLPLEKFHSKKKLNIIITILDEISDKEDLEIRNMTSDTQSFDFWENDSENLYQEYLK